MRAVWGGTSCGLKTKLRHGKASREIVTKKRHEEASKRFLVTLIRDGFFETSFRDVVYLESFRTTAASRDLCLAALL